MTSGTFYHKHPDILTLETQVKNTLPGRVLLEQSPLFPGGGGQLADHGQLRWSHGELTVTGFEKHGDSIWAVLEDQSVVITGQVEVQVDPVFRQTMTELHTSSHVLNAYVFQEFEGALVTGVQMSADGTARMDFDLPNAENQKLRSLEDPINASIQENLSVTDQYVPMAEAELEEGLIRSKSVTPPPTDDGTIRIVEIVGLDRQACGGTHLPSTGASSPIRILKITNKGKHNRRVRFGLTTALDD